jgi:hypothetical protein
MIVSRAAFLQSKGYNEGLVRYEDWEWLLRVLRTGHFLALPDELVTISHGYRAAPAAALAALDKLAQSAALNGLSPSQFRIFWAAIALERASLLFLGNRRFAAAMSILAAMRHRPAWVVRAVSSRITAGAVPGA